MEDRALELAMAGNDRLIMFLLQAHKPEVYQPKLSIEFAANVSLNLRRTPLDELRSELADHLVLTMAGSET